MSALRGAAQDPASAHARTHTPHQLAQLLVQACHARRAHAPFHIARLYAPECQFVHSCFYPAGEGPFPGRMRECRVIHQNLRRSRITHRALYVPSTLVSSSVGHPVHSRLPVQVGVTGFWSMMMMMSFICSYRNKKYMVWFIRHVSYSIALRTLQSSFPLKTEG